MRKKLFLVIFVVGCKEKYEDVIGNGWFDGSVILVYFVEFFLYMGSKFFNCNIYENYKEVCIGKLFYVINL